MQGRRDDPVELLGDEGSGGSWPGRLTADVEQVRALAKESSAVADGLLGLVPAASVRERVRGHVDHAHDQAPAGRGEPVDVAGWSGVEP